MPGRITTSTVQTWKLSQSPQEEYYLKLFSILDGSSLASMIASMKLLVDLYETVIQTSHDQTNWENAASALTVEMSWDVNCDMDLHCYFLNESGNLHYIFYQNPRYCAKCDVLSRSRNQGCKCPCLPLNLKLNPIIHFHENCLHLPESCFGER